MPEITRHDVDQAIRVLTYFYETEDLTLSTTVREGFATAVANLDWVTRQAEFRATVPADNTDSVKSTESVTPLQAAKNFGMTDTLAEQYLAAIAERDDHLAWLDTPELERPDWTIHAVEIPADAEHAVDTKYGRTAWIFGAGLAVYDEEPDAIVSLAPTDNDRFRPLTRSANAPVAKYEHVSDAPSLDAYIAAVSEEIGYQTDRDVDLDLDD